MQTIDVNRNKIKRARELRGWSQGDVAEKLGCDARSVGRWERGVVSPSAYYRQKLCQLFEQNMEELGFLEEATSDVQKSVPLEQEAVHEHPEQNREEIVLSEGDAPTQISQMDPESARTVQIVSYSDKDPFLQKRDDRVQSVSIVRAIPARMLIEILLLLLIIVGSISVFNTFYSMHSIKIPTNAVPLRTTPISIVSIKTPPVSTVPINTPPVEATPVSIIPYGKLLYTTMTPGSKCDFGGGQWVDYNRPDIQCLATQSIISNPSSTSPDLRGTLLTGIPGNLYPDNYVLEAQVQQPVTAADFGLYFRNQPGDQQGIYTFSIHPNGSWSAYVYDNVTAVQTLIGSGKTVIDPHAQLYLTVVAVGADFTLYINRQKVGEVHNAEYGTGTVGIAVDAGGTIVVNKISLYSVA